MTTLYPVIYRNTSMRWRDSRRWRRGVAVTSLSVSMRLLCVGPS